MVRKLEFNMLNFLLIVLFISCSINCVIDD
jgi:hypothetical protein